MKIEKPCDLVDALRLHYGAISDYQLGKMLSFDKSRVSTWRQNRSWPDDDLLLDFEKLLKIPDGSLYFSMLADRTKCPRAISILHKTAEKIAAGALCFMLVFPIVFDGLANASPSAGHFVRSLLCILCKIKQALILTRSSREIFPTICHFAQFSCFTYLFQRYIEKTQNGFSISFNNGLCQYD